MTLLKTFLAQTAVIADRFFINKWTGCGETGARSGVGQLHKRSWLGLVSGKAYVGGSNRTGTGRCQHRANQPLLATCMTTTTAKIGVRWFCCGKVCQTDSLFFARYHCAGGNTEWLWA